MNYLSGYQATECQNYTTEGEPVSSYEFKDTLYVVISGFDGEVRTKLDAIMDQHKDKTNVYFDIHCNSGGYLNDINHVLKYMSNQPWAIFNHDNYGGETKTDITVEEDRYIDRKYYLVTGVPTFSAANYLTTIVKDFDLATIVGEQSYGGTCAIEPLTLPDGTIFVRSSSSTCAIDKNGQSVESGIPVDKELDLGSLYKNSTGYESFLEAIINNTLE